MLPWPLREHRSVRRVRSWTRRRLWPRAARGDRTSCRATDSPCARRTATGSASSCTGAATWDGVTNIFPRLPCDELATHPGCHPAFARRLLGEAPADPRDPEQEQAGKYVYQPMTNVCQLPSTAVPPAGAECSDAMDLSLSLAERFLKLAPCFQSPPPLESPKYCVISDLFTDDYIVKRINGKMCYVQRPPPPLPEPPRAPSPTLPPAPPAPHVPAGRVQPRRAAKPAAPTHRGPAGAPQQPPPPPLPPPPPAAPVQAVQQLHSEHKPSPVDKIKGPKMEQCSSPSSSEDSGINALGLHYLESCEDESEEEEEEEECGEGEGEEGEDELSTDGNSSPGSLWDQDDCSLLLPSKSMIEIIEKIETTV